MWSELPKDIIILILKRLILADYVRFGAVCVSWRSVAVLSNSPISKNLGLCDCIIAAAFDDRTLAFHRLVDEKWIVLQKSSHMDYDAIIFYKGFLYAIKREELEVWELGSNPPQVRTAILLPLEVQREGSYEIFWVESCGKLLFVIQILGRFSFFFPGTTGFQVFEIDPIDLCLVMVESLGDQMILLGEFGFLSLKAKDLIGSEFRENFIYFAEDGICKTFNLADGTVEAFLPGRYHSFEVGLVTVTPNPW
ncbi:F-box protein At4g35733-like [Tasmannia lanceolata]|uniref:F-box protein At4g35733-like n=1 Tax=Tasmannia lanceolata TaxID=3420 RepID=UPI004062E0B3